MQAMQKKQDIISQIRDLGLAKGDTVFVSSDLLRVGYFNKDQVTTLCDWIEIFDELLGDKGTIVVPTYSPSFLRFIQKYDFVFTAESDSDSGGLARAYIHHAKGAVRGRHPTNSCTSRGAHAETIAASDGPEFPKYNPYAKVVELGGKNLMLGTVDERNCPFTYHHVQELLGQTRGHPFSGFLEDHLHRRFRTEKKVYYAGVGWLYRWCPQVLGTSYGSKRCPLWPCWQKSQRSG